MYPHDREAWCHGTVGGKLLKALLPCRLQIALDLLYCFLQNYVARVDDSHSTDTKLWAVHQGVCPAPAFYHK